MNDERHNKRRKFLVIALLALFLAVLAIVLADEALNLGAITVISYINASNISQSGLASVTGNLSDLDDINGYDWDGVESTNPFAIFINFTNVTHFDYLEIKARYYSVTGTPSSHIVDVEVWCESESDYVDMFDMSNHAEWQYFTRRFPDPDHFITSNGNVTIKLNHSANGNTQHRINITTARLIEQTILSGRNGTLSVNNYYNTTGGGGGVSFNGSPVNGNGSNLYNITIDGKNISQTFDNINNSKVNKSGDTFDVNAKIIQQSNKSTVNQNLYETYNNDSLRTKLTTMGTQYWYINTSDSPYGVDTPLGLIAYVNPNQFPGIAFLNGSNGHRSDFRSTPNGIELWVGTAGTLGSMTQYIILYRNGTVQMSNLTGSGNDYVCVDPNGVLFRSNAAC